MLALFLPIGLLAKALGAARDQHMEAEMAASGHQLDRERFLARSKELWEGCVGPEACLLVLGHNDWSDCTVDIMKVPVDPSRAAGEAAAPAGYRDAVDLLGPGPHGLLAVCPGKHVVETRLGARVARITIALYPREAFFLRLDRESATWTEYEKPECAQILERLGSGSLDLLHYTTAIAERLVRESRARTAKEALGPCIVHMKQALEHLLANEEQLAVGQTQLAGGALFHASVLSFEPLTSFVGFNAFDLVGKGKHKEAWLLLQAGLSLLPGNPTLLAALGEIQLGAGSLAEGRANLELALSREAGLDARVNARARDLLARM